MELLGQIREREITYCNVCLDKNWFHHLPNGDWIAFTIVDNEDKELLPEMIVRCLDKGVCYTDSIRELASLTKDYFDEEIAWRKVQKSGQTGKPQDYESTPIAKVFMKL